MHKTEEKGSDVNVATMLLLDAVRNEYDEAVIISNDSDLVMPIRMRGPGCGWRRGAPSSSN